VGERVTSSATWRRGAGEGCEASAAVRRRSMADSGPTVALMGDARASGMRPAAK
jgi:hypothetical protein